LDFYPNPTSSVVYFSEESKIKVHDIQGVFLLEAFAKQVDLSTYPQGMYLLEVNGKWIKVIKN
jgi:hypothetical protein